MIGQRYLERANLLCVENSPVHVGQPIICEQNYGQSQSKVTCLNRWYIAKYGNFNRPGRRSYADVLFLLERYVGLLITVKLDPDMITTSISKDYVPFGRVNYELHTASSSKDSSSKSLSEAVGNISIYDIQVGVYI